MVKRESDKPQEQSSLRELGRWLLLVPVAFLILFGCGQLALSETAYPIPDTRSRLRADYGTWPNVTIPAINPAIMEDIRRDEKINPGVSTRAFWPTSDRPAATAQPTFIAQQPTTTPLPPTSTPPLSTTPTYTPQPARTATPLPTHVVWPTPTASSWPTATETPLPTATSKPPRPAPSTTTPTPAMPATMAPLPSPTEIMSDTPTSTPTDTLTPSPTDTPSPTLTPTATFTPAVTLTHTPTPTDTAIATATATLAPSPTSTPQLCAGDIPPGEPNIGPPNGSFAEIPCNSSIELDLGSQTITSHSGYDLVYYEHAGCSGICLDWVRVDVCTDAACTNPVTVFNWGDDVPDTNTNVASFAAGGEIDNEDIPAAALLNGTGITIDVDAFGPVPAGGYRYIRIWSPINWPNNDGAEVDSIEVMP